MKTVEFAYWLQGYFEINGEEKSLTEKQALRVLAQAQNAKAGARGLEAQGQTFVAYTQGVLLSVAEGLADEAYLKSATQKLKGKLHDLFAHAIDPSYGADQSDFQDIHDGGSRRKPSRDDRMLC